MEEDALKQEFRFFVDHQEELVKQYKGRIIAIKGEEVLGAFDSYVEAVAEASKRHSPGTFMVQKCEPGPDCYTAVFQGDIFAPIEVSR